MKPKLRLFKGVTRIAGLNGDTDWTDFVANMGYLVYTDPINDDFVIVSDKVLTYKWLKDHPKQFGIDLKWWNDETDFNSMLDEELDDYY